MGPDEVIVHYEPGHGGRVCLLDIAEYLLAVPEGAVEPLLDVVVLLAPKARLAYVPALLIRNCSSHIIRQTINVSSIGRRLDTKLHEQMKICVNSMLCLMA